MEQNKDVPQFEYSQRSFKEIRKNQLMLDIQLCWDNFLSTNPYTDDFYYKSLLTKLKSYYNEIKFEKTIDPDKTKHIEKLSKVLDSYIKMKPIIVSRTLLSQWSDKKTEPVISPEPYRIIRDGLQHFQDKILEVDEQSDSDIESTKENKPFPKS